MRAFTSWEIRRKLWFEKWVKGRMWWQGYLSHCVRRVKRRMDFSRELWSACAEPALGTVVVSTGPGLATRAGASHRYLPKLHLHIVHITPHQHILGVLGPALFFWIPLLLNLCSYSWTKQEFSILARFSTFWLVMLAPQTLSALRLNRMGEHRAVRGINFSEIFFKGTNESQCFKNSSDCTSIAHILQGI